MQIETRSVRWRKALRMAKENKALYMMILPAFLYIVIFHYWPMYGVQIAFRDFNFVDGITGSKWVGMKWFNYFFRSNQFEMVVVNTLAINFYDLIAGFPIPILLALIMSNVPSRGFRRVAQTISYMPHFISVVVLVGMMSCMFSINTGWVNGVVRSMGGTPVHLMGEAEYYRHVYVWSAHQHRSRPARGRHDRRRRQAAPHLAHRPARHYAHGCHHADHALRQHDVLRL